MAPAAARSFGLQSPVLRGPRGSEHHGEANSATSIDVDHCASDESGLSAQLANSVATCRCH